MTDRQDVDLLRRLIDAVEDQIRMTGHDEADPMDVEPEHRAAVLDGLMQAERGEFSEKSVEEIVAAAFARTRP